LIFIPQVRHSLFSPVTRIGSAGGGGGISGLEGIEGMEGNFDLEAFFSVFMAADGV
jgi:hypothetical protein